MDSANTNHPDPNGWWHYYQMNNAYLWLLDAYTKLEGDLSAAHQNNYILMNRLATAEAKICHLEGELSKEPQAPLNQDDNVSDRAKIDHLLSDNNSLREHLKHIFKENQRLNLLVGHLRPYAGPPVDDSFDSEATTAIGEEDSAVSMTVSQ